MAVRSFQSDATEQGVLFALNCKSALKQAGFDPDEIRREFHLDDAGVTVDFKAMNNASMDFLFECKGSMAGRKRTRPGSKRTDTVKKAIANGFLIKNSRMADFFPPMILMTSHVATSGDARQMFKCVPTSIILAVINPWDHGDFLQFILEADEHDIQTWIIKHATAADTIDELWCR